MPEKDRCVERRPEEGGYYRAHTVNDHALRYRVRVACVVEERERAGRGGGGAYSFGPWFNCLTIDQAPLSRCRGGGLQCRDGARWVVAGQADIACVKRGPP